MVIKHKSNMWSSIDLSAPFSMQICSGRLFITTSFKKLLGVYLGNAQMSNPTRGMFSSVSSLGRVLVTYVL